MWGEAGTTHLSLCALRLLIPSSGSTQFCLWPFCLCTPFQPPSQPPKKKCAARTGVARSRGRPGSGVLRLVLRHHLRRLLVDGGHLAAAHALHQAERRGQPALGTATRMNRRQGEAAKPTHKQLKKMHYKGIQPTKKSRVTFSICSSLFCSFHSLWYFSKNQAALGALGKGL